MKITKEIVQYIANLSKIKLDDESTAKMQNELGAIIEYMDILNSVDTNDLEPMSHVLSITNVMRDDEVLQSYDRIELLNNAPSHTDESFVVPNTID